MWLRVLQIPVFSVQVSQWSVLTQSVTVSSMWIWCIFLSHFWLHHCCSVSLCRKICLIFCEVGSSFCLLHSVYWAMLFRSWLIYGGLLHRKKWQRTSENLDKIHWLWHNLHCAVCNHQILPGDWKWSAMAQLYNSNKDFFCFYSVFLNN